MGRTSAFYGVMISPELAIGGRQPAVETIHKWLESESPTLTIEGESSEEASCFIAASLAVLPPEKREFFESRLIFVDGPAGVDAISSGPAGLLVIPITDAAPVKAKVNHSPGTRTLFPRGRAIGQATTGGDTVKLGMIRRQACEDAVRLMGVPAPEASRIAAASLGSFGATLWMIARDMEHPPTWTEP